MLKTVFMGTPPFVMPVVETLNENSDLKLIVTGLDQKAGRGNKKIIIPEPKKFGIENDIDIYQIGSINEDEFLNILKKYNVDLAIVYAFGFILPENIYDYPKCGSFNIHGSLLPKYRGASPVHQALLNQDKVTGITYQKITNKLDCGDILFSKEVEILPEDDYLSLNKKLAILAGDTIKEFLKLFDKDKLEYKTQNENKASYCKKIKKEDGEFIWNDLADNIIAKIKAFIKWPVAYVNTKIGKLRIYKADKCGNTNNEKPGTIIKADKKGLCIACKKDAICIKELQPENKRKMDYISFLNGHRLNVGEKL